MTPSKPVVLVVDDDKNTRDGLQRALRTRYEVLVADNGERALDILNGRDVDILLSDIRMPGLDGLTLLQRALARRPGLICILLTAYGNVETAVEAMKRGAYDFLTKPLHLDHLDLLLGRALRSRQVETENADLQRQLNDKYGLESLVGHSAVMKQVYEVITQAAPTQATVLIQGESGTGKELVAHAIHRLSTRARGPFVAVHSAALSPTLLESELFGHERGAFTGAIARRKGRFENADGGTLFLDEISEIDPAVQVKLLRVLEERRFERVGGDETVEVDIRLISATNRDLKTLVAEGKFREDLFFRLDVVNITLPPLRERLEDIPLLCAHFLGEFNERNRKQIEGFTPDAMAELTGYAWPGNVRELRTAIEHAVVLCRGDKIAVRDLPVSLRDAVTRAPDDKDPRRLLAHNNLTVKEAERELIIRALKATDGHRTLAAQKLGMSRRNFHRKLHQHHLEGF